MGRHSKDEPEDDGRNFENMEPGDKAKAFDASHADPRGYAQRHFGAGSDDEINDAKRRQGH